MSQQAGHRTESVLRNEHLVGVHRIAGGAAHPRGEPGVLDGRVGRRDQRGGRIEELAVVVDDRNPDVRPIGMRRTTGPVPRAADDVAAVDLAGGGARGEHAGHPGVGVGAPHIVLGLLAGAPGEVRADVHQRRHPAGRSAAHSDGAGHLELGANVRLVAAVPLGHHHLERAGVAQRSDVLLDDAPVRLGLSGIALQRRANGGDALKQSIGGLSHGGVPSKDRSNRDIGVAVIPKHP